MALPPSSVIDLPVAPTPEPTLDPVPEPSAPNPLEDPAGYFQNLARNHEFLPILLQEILPLLNDPRFEGILKSLSNNVWVEIVGSLKGQGMSQMSRDILLANLVPEARAELSSANNAALVKENIDDEKFNEFMGAIGSALVSVAIRVGKGYLPIPVP